MGITYNLYCDESCHLENDGQKAMLLGAIWSPTDKAHEINVRIRDIKKRHGLAPSFEIKWTKVSAGQLQFYLDLVDYFFDTSDLHFRGLIVPDKTTLQHALFKSDHDTWYYKMYFEMLKMIFTPTSCYRIFIDIKDTRGGPKITKLWDVLCNNMYDFQREIIKIVQQVRSHESEQLQLADLLIGAVSYVNRELKSSPAKLAVIDRIKQRSGYTLTLTTLLREDKFNLLRWQRRNDPPS